jgi:hypothetical protein
MLARTVPLGPEPCEPHGLQSWGDLPCLLAARLHAPAPAATIQAHWTGLSCEQPCALGRSAGGGRYVPAKRKAFRPNWAKAACWGGHLVLLLGAGHGLIASQGHPSGGVRRPRASGRFASSSGRHVATLFSATALALSLYSSWKSSLRPADIHLYVPPVIQLPYQNSNFEMIAIPITVPTRARKPHASVDGAGRDRSQTNETKHFYSADFGRWTMERTRSGAYQPFAPISLGGHTSRIESVLCRSARSS